MEESKKKNNQQLFGLYIHIPFCIKKCDYCDFYSIPMCNVVPDYIDALIKEIYLRSDKNKRIDTIYFGGGTPSVLKVKDIRRIYEAIQLSWKIDPQSEITIEVNPGTVSKEKITELKSIGINRINIGIQSFHEKYLKILGRIHTSKESFNAINLAQKAGFKNIGLDLIYGIPDQTPDEWEKDLDMAIDLNPEHISSYLLTYEPGTIIHKKKINKTIVPLTDNIIAQMMNKLIFKMETNNFDHYETSNFASSADFRSKHNQKYWKQVPYIGIGAAAHSYYKNTRYWNHSNVNAYIKKIYQNLLPTENSEKLTINQQIIESIFLGLRSKEGIIVKDFETKFKSNFYELFSEPLGHLIKDSYIEYSSFYCRLSRSGHFFLDSIVEQFINSLYNNWNKGIHYD